MRTVQHSGEAGNGLMAEIVVCGIAFAGFLHTQTESVLRHDLTGLRALEKPASRLE